MLQVGRVRGVADNNKNRSLQRFPFYSSLRGPKKLADPTIDSLLIYLMLWLARSFSAWSRALFFLNSPIPNRVSLDQKAAIFAPNETHHFRVPFSILLYWRPKLISYIMFDGTRENS